MEILILTSEFAPATGGIATYAREIAAAAVQLGANVTLAAPDYSHVDVLLEDRSLPFSTLRFRGGLHSIRDVPDKIRLARRLVRAKQYDTIHAVDWPFFIPLALARKYARGRLLMSFHGTEINEMQTRIKRLAVCATGVFNPRAELVANSRFTRDLLLMHFPVAQARAIPLGVSEFWFGRCLERGLTRKRLGIAENAIVMVSVARLTRRKGHLAALAALASLPERLRDRVTWLVVGPDGERDYVETLRQTATASHCDVRFLGRLSDEEVRDVYGASNFFCLTGTWDSSGRVEGFGLVYLEAGACGLPSVATAVGGVPDAVVAGRTGLLVNPAIESIADAIASLIESAAACAALGTAAREHAKALSWKRCAAETYQLHPAAPKPIALVYETPAATVNLPAGATRPPQLARG